MDLDAYPGVLPWVRQIVGMGTDTVNKESGHGGNF